MLSLIIAVVIGVFVGWVTSRDLGPAWGVVCGVAGVMLVQLIIGLVLRRVVGVRQREVQEIMQNAQAKAERQLTLFQQRQPGNLRSAQQLAEKLQREALKSGLEATAGFAPYYKWSPLLRRQIAAMQMQIYYQLRDYRKVDELLPKCLLADPQSLAIKLARMYRNSDPGLDKFYRRKCRRAKGDAGAFLASVYAWIKLRQDDQAGALDALVTARKFSDHQVLLDNCDRLLNGKTRHFSNAGFGDIWYALGLEELKIKPQRQRMGRPF